MGLINSVPTQTNLGAIVSNQIDALAACRGIDSGEYRRCLLNAATERALEDFRRAHGCYPTEYLAKVDTGSILKCPRTREGGDQAQEPIGAAYR